MGQLSQKSTDPSTKHFQDKYTSRFTLYVISCTLFFFVAALGPFNLFVPHSLTLNEARNHLMVADRENSRILCYDVNGVFVHEIRDDNRMFAVAYSSALGRFCSIY